MKRLLFFTFAFMFVGVAHATDKTMDWYVDGESYDSTTCTLGDDVVFPSNPTRTGHTFIGWGSLNDLDTSTNGTANTSNAQNKTWNVTFSYGKVYGESFCSNKMGAANSYETYYGNLSTRTPNVQSDSYDVYCWCKVIGFQPANVAYIPFSTLPWTFSQPFAANCSRQCSDACATKFKTTATMRRNAYVITQ